MYIISINLYDILILNIFIFKKKSRLKYMITGLIIYCSGEIEPIEYDDKYFIIYNTELKINDLSVNYCIHMECYNHIANYLINQYNIINNIINNIYGNVYIFKLNDLDEFISFSNDEIKYIMNQFTGVL